MGLVSLEDARAHVLERVTQALPAERVPIADAVGRVAAEAVHAPEPVPAFANSAMDGYAVRAGDTATAPVVLREVGRTLAGEGPAAAIGAGEAVRIMTGAPVPEGADAVVPVEVVRTADDGTVHIDDAVPSGQHVRPVGDDIQPGDEILAAGAAVTPAHLALLATLGVGEVAVHRRPRIGVLSTGDELVAGPGPLRAGQIRDSNRAALLALTAAAGAEPVDLGLAPDDAEAITKAVLDGVTTCDAVLSSGGVSMGDVDLVKEVLDLLGEMRWMQVAIRPAKPFAFGVVDGVPVFGLPGNPVSSVVSFELFARPAIRRLLGYPDGHLDRPCLSAVAVDGLSRRPDGKMHFVRVIAEVGSDGRLAVRSAGGQGSHQLSALAVANGLAVLPDGDGVAPGGDVDVLLTGGPVSTPLVDSFGRTHRDLRISVTDRCNFRCTYCMPAEGMEWLDRSEVLTFEEIERVARVCVERFGFDSIRLTGGEPTVRAHLPVLVAKLARLGVDLSMTTNGATLALVAHDLADAGLRRVNISLDSLRHDRFAALTRRDVLDRVLEGIDAALSAGLTPVKVNAVIVRGHNDDEIVDLARFGRDRGVVLRFIEYMPLDAEAHWESDQVMPSAEIVAAIHEHWPVEAQAQGHDPAQRWRYRDDAGEFGVIPSVTEAFCSSCDRVRLTADGALRACLFAVEETDLRGPMRTGATDDDLAALLATTVAGKWAGHGIGQVHFLRPRRSMSQIGG